MLAGTFFISYFYHAEVYRFLLDQYYSRAYPDRSYMGRALKLYETGKYAELKEFCEPLIFVYSGDNELKRLAGMNYIRLGEELKGAELYASAIDGETGGFDAAKVIKILYYNRSYGDLLAFYNRRILVDNMDMAYYYGVSLLMMERADEALVMLESAMRSGFSDRRGLYYHMGLACEKKRDNRRAEEFLVKAYEAGPADDEIVRALVRVFSKTGKYESAELLLRKRRL